MRHRAAVRVVVGVVCAAAVLTLGWSVRPVIAAQTAEQFATAESARVETFAWLAGCWSMALPDGVVEEHWLAPAGGAMLGLSRTIRAGNLREWEFLALRPVDGILSYVSIPSRQRETVFPLVRHKSTVLIFENPAHDYPQRIIYRKTAEGIEARIEGRVKDQLRGSDFKYQRC